MRESNKGSVPVRQAASVILLRPRPGSGELEVLLQRRHSKASFMASAFVFPGGTADPGETDLRVTAARELFEEAGVLLARPRRRSSTERIRLDAVRARSWRHELGTGARTLTDLLGKAGLAVDLDALHYFAHWITPSHEQRRFSAVFYVAAMPAGQEASMDDAEAVETTWVTPAEALARATELRLPPPQIRTFLDLREAASHGMDAVLALSSKRADHPHPILPRVATDTSEATLLLPWDPDYRTAGTGEGLDMPADHLLAVGPSRFVLEDMTWRHIGAPSSPAAE